MDLYAYTYTTLEFLCFYFIIRSLLNLPLKPQKNDIIGSLIALFILISSSSNWLIGQVIFLLYITILYTKNFFDGIILHGLTFSFMFLSELIVASIISRFHLNSNFPYINIIGNVLTFILLNIIFRIKPIKNLYNMVSRAALPYRLILLNTYLIFLGILLVFKAAPKDFYMHLTTYLFIALLLVIVNISILYYDRLVYTQKQELQSYQKNLPIYESLINEIRANQHEYSNRLQNLQNLSNTCTDYDSLCQALQQHTKEYTHPLHAYPLLQIDMPLLAAALYNLSCRAETENITLYFDVVSEHLESHAPEYLLTDFACIITQNAIEASKPGDSIYIHISSENGMVQYEIRNPVDKRYTSQDIQMFFKKNYSTKSDIQKEDLIPHGFGLFNLVNNVTKWNGTIGADCVEYNNKFWIIFTLDI